MKKIRAFATLGVVSCLFLVSHERVLAQESAQGNLPVSVAVRSIDEAAVSSKLDYRVHVRHVKVESMDRFSPLASGAANMKTAVQSAEKGKTASPELAPTVADASIPGVPPPGFYPADLSYMGGPVVVTAETHNLFVDCQAKCWADPEKFQGHLYSSNFIHVADQYVGSTANNRYTQGKSAVMSYPIIATLSDNDILQIVHASAATMGTGYNHIYNVFLPKGVDECFVGTTQCYSPDNPSTFAFCAYHGSVTFSDIGHVLFTVEPFQDVQGCGMVQPSPNGPLVDATSSVLGHETFETITDPDPPSGWVAINSGGVFGEEIGDLCPGVSLTQPLFEDPVILLNGKNYEVQPMYSNKYHACSFAP